jgi:hypothetical protein
VEDLAAKTEGWEYDNEAEMQIALQFTYDAWAETPGAIDLIEALSKNHLAGYHSTASVPPKAAGQGTRIRASTTYTHVAYGTTFAAEIELKIRPTSTSNSTTIATWI